VDSRRIEGSGGARVLRRGGAAQEGKKVAACRSVRDKREPKWLAATITVAW
jgi:hypothetical protein